MYNVWNGSHAEKLRCDGVDGGGGMFTRTSSDPTPSWKLLSSHTLSNIKKKREYKHLSCECVSVCVCESFVKPQKNNVSHSPTTRQHEQKRLTLREQRAEMTNCRPCLINSRCIYMTQLSPHDWTGKNGFAISSAINLSKVWVRTLTVCV